MGLFDTVYTEYPLPDARHQDLEFQTKDIECCLDTYTITREVKVYGLQSSTQAIVQKLQALAPDRPLHP
jgi:hypothetical protein